MMDSDLFAFADVVRGLQRVFPKRLDEHEHAQLQRDYFRALRRFPLSQVEAGAEVWLQRGKYFPKPAEWIDAIPRRQQTSINVDTLSEADAREHRRAESLGYEDVPCGCLDCQRAEVSEKPIRFVPEFLEDGRDRHVKDGDRIVTAGHWAHGDELARWYRARADFWERCHALGLTKVAKELDPVRR